jgi:hypothetical protein
LLAFVDNLCFRPQDSGYLVSILLKYETELEEQLLRPTEIAERSEQQFFRVCPTRLTKNRASRLLFNELRKSKLCAFKTFSSQHMIM